MTSDELTSFLLYSGAHLYDLLSLYRLQGCTIMFSHTLSNLLWDCGALIKSVAPYTGDGAPTKTLSGPKGWSKTD